MAFEKWKESSGKTKIASGGMALSAVLSIIIGFAILDDLEDALGVLSSFIDVGGILVVYVLLFFAIDVAVAAGLFFVSGWARRITMYWGVLSLVSIISGIVGGGFSAWFVPQIITVISAVAVFGAKDDFPAKPGKER
jgi:hypothetical protein